MPLPFFAATCIACGMVDNSDLQVLHNQYRGSLVIFATVAWESTMGIEGRITCLCLLQRLNNMLQGTEIIATTTNGGTSYRV